MPNAKLTPEGEVIAAYGAAMVAAFQVLINCLEESVGSRINAKRPEMDVRASARWHNWASSSGVPAKPNANAVETTSAALDDRPAPIGRVVVTEPVAPTSGCNSFRYSAMASVSQIEKPSLTKHGTRMEDERSSSSARAAGSSGATTMMAGSTALKTPSPARLPCWKKRALWANCSSRDGSRSAPSSTVPGTEKNQCCWARPNGLSITATS